MSQTPTMTSGVPMDTASRDPALAWLLKGDPAIRWQVFRDLLGRPVKEWRAEQARVASDGWAARLLARQDIDGRWTPRLYGQKWISTTYSMVLLRQLGLPNDDPRAAVSCRLFLEEGLWRDGGIRVEASKKRSETCVTGLVLGLLSWFRVADPRREQLVAYLLDQQMEDGGWNCQRDGGATHSSFHTTINVLEGLREYVEGNGPRAAEVRRAEARGREFFLTHRLYRSHRTGRVVDSAFTRFSFPPWWRHDVLRTMDTSVQALLRWMRGSRTRSAWSCRSAPRTDAGGSRTGTRAPRSLRWKQSEGRAAGTR